ncbi:MAG: DUF3047 domain-containing protein [Giesbergeria sp.]|nr:DUF3047 domain-containing protein [Giesbergeria sp.]
MLNRRQTLSLLALGSSAAATTLAPFALHAQDNGAAPAPQPADAAQPIPPFSRAALGDAVPPGWMHQRLPKVERANTFAIVQDAARRVLQVQSAQSSSSWVHQLNGDAGQRPWLHWQWKVSHALAGSDFGRKEGDDFAARLYVFFDLPPERLSLGDRLKLAAARALSGNDLPAAALCYVWGHAQPVGASGWNPYTDRVRMVVVDSQNAQADRWRSHTRDLRRDWADAFGGTMPRVGGVAVGADTDNTGGQVTAWFGDLRLEAQA